MTPITPPLYRSIPSTTCLHITSLTLSGRHLTVVPEPLSQLVFLNILDLNHNALNKFPQLVLSFTHLLTLNLSHNSLRSIPREIGSMPQLLGLCLNKCHLSSVPPEIFLPQLQVLALSYNHLSTLPEPYDNQPPNLFYFIGINNQFNEIPRALFRCRKLQAVVLDNNRICSIPSTIEAWESLALLSLRNNPIEEVEENAFRTRFYDIQLITVEGSKYPFEERITRYCMIMVMLSKLEASISSIKKYRIVCSPRKISLDDSPQDQKELAYQNILSAKNLYLKEYNFLENLLFGTDQNTSCTLTKYLESYLGMLRTKILHLHSLLFPSENLYLVDIASIRSPRTLSDVSSGSEPND